MTRTQILHSIKKKVQESVRVRGSFHQWESEDGRE